MWILGQYQAFLAPINPDIVSYFRAPSGKIESALVADHALGPKLVMSCALCRIPEAEGLPHRWNSKALRYSTFTERVILAPDGWDAQ